MPKIALVVAGALAAAPAAAMPSGCPGKVVGVELEAGHYTPPATLAPDISRKGGRYQSWSGLSKATPVEAVTLTCRVAGKPPQRIVLPRKVDRCVLDAGRMTCS
ncbi:MAG: hypothetical protein B7Y45_13435 [Sphingomonas sp. 28-66-16]|nr:MAG: hypothetical protein B7Y45_13435 [Sphingomonas sp. 28-66-16]